MSNVDPNKSPDAFLAEIEKGAAESHNFFSSEALNVMLPPFAGLLVRLSKDAAQTASTNAKTADKTLTFTKWLLWITIVLLLVTGFPAALEFMKFYESHYRHPNPNQTQQHNAGEISSLPAPTADQQQSLTQTPKIEQPKGEAERREQAAAPNKRGTDEVPLPVKVVPAPDTERKAAEEKQERDKKTTTEDRLVEWTHALFWATAALAFVAAVQAGLFVWQLFLMRDGVKVAALAAGAARESADAARASIDLAQIDQRPWVSVDISIISPVTYDSNGNAHITFRFSLTNVGRSPAINIEVFPMIYPMSNKRFDARLEQKRWLTLAAFSFRQKKDSLAMFCSQDNHP
jgi:hypothetical protein